MESFFATLITVILILYLLRLLARLLLPFLMKRFFNNVSNHFGASQNTFFGQTDDDEQRPEGDVKVHSRPQESQSSSSELEGEYVDFEEVE